MGMNRGDIIREKRGGDWHMWRVEETYEADSPYVFAILVTSSKFDTAGMRKRMLPKANYKVEPDPHGWAFGKFRNDQVVLDVHLHPKASW